MAQFYGDGDADLASIQARRIAVIGYGNQGHAHALNLRDSGCEVRVGLRPHGAGWSRARVDGFTVQTVDEVCAWADVISILLPDQYHKPVFEASIRPHLAAGKLLLTAHGFSLHYRQIVPPGEVDVALVAPIGPGHVMRRLYREGRGEPAVLAVYQDVSNQTEQVALAYAAAIGCTRAGVVRSTVAEETVANLFGEQTVLCGGVPDLIQAGFETLVRAGYQPEVAYFECVQTVKLIVDLIYEGGMDYMRSRISETAEYGSYMAGPQIVDEHVREAMSTVLHNVESGRFARDWIADFEAGAPVLERLRQARKSGEIDVIGERLRRQALGTATAAHSGE